ncbi:unnamed protein product [Laminaria digitata]
MALATSETVSHEGRLREQLIEKGMTIIPPSELDLEAFKAAVLKEVSAEFEGKVWPEGLLDQISKIQ